MKRKKKAPHIGQLNERSLHADIKAALLLPGDRCEVMIGRYVVDIVRDNLLIEIQTGNFTALRRKIMDLSGRYIVRVVYPLVLEKWIVKKKSGDDDPEKRRKSPKKGRLIDIFKELVYIPELFINENLEIELLLIRMEEIRINDGKGSWRRKGVSIVDRRLLEITGHYLFRTVEDFRRFVPEGIAVPFSNSNLAAYTGYSVRDAGKVTYCLKKMGVIREVGKKRNALLFEPVNPAD
ncbi:MAG: hypothetical protein JW881_06080 [Spirochaetales bacterium]|nr:hypothetical protein [Spirochaetales bacterium]